MEEEINDYEGAEIEAEVEETEKFTGLTVNNSTLITILGIRGHGKTWLSKALMTMYPNENIFVHDPMNDYPLEDFEHCIDTDQVIDKFMSGSKRVRLVQGNPVDIPDLLEFLKEFDDILIVIDEADQIFTRRETSEGIFWITHYGRHANQAMILIARRPPLLPIDFTAQAVFCFNRVIEPNDMQYVKNRLGYIPDPLDKYNWYALETDGNLCVIDSNWIAERN